MVMKTSSSALTAIALTVFAAMPAGASGSDAREVFSVAAAGAMTFAGDRVVEDVSVVYLHFTPEGRSALISELERTGIVAEVVSKRLSVRSDLPISSVQAHRRVGVDGLDEYDMTGDMRLQWSRCEPAGCSAVGAPKAVKVSGVVVQSTLNGRPAYRISSIRYEGGR